MLVEGSAEFLTGLRKLLLQLVGLEGDGIPFVLESGEEGGDGGEGRRTWANGALCLELDKVVGGELFAVDGVGAMLGNVCLNQTLLENISCGRVSCGARRDSLAMDKPLFFDATGTCGASPETRLWSVEMIERWRRAYLTCAQHFGRGLLGTGAIAWSYWQRSAQVNRNFLGANAPRLSDLVKHAEPR